MLLNVSSNTIQQWVMLSCVQVGGGMRDNTCDNGRDTLKSFPAMPPVCDVQSTLSQTI